MGDATIDGTDQAFVYSGGSLYSLTSLLASSLPAGDTLTKAVSINDNGVIAAQGDVPNGKGGYYYHTYLLTLPGDANFDGRVDINDLTIVLSNFGKTAGASWTTGDFVGDGRVDINDLTIVLSHFGQSLGTSVAAMATVPEPSTMAIAATAHAGFAGLRGRTAGRQSAAARSRPGRQELLNPS